MSLVRDVSLKGNEPTQLLSSLHAKYLSKYGESETELEYALTDFLRISGVYWCTTALDIIGKKDLLEREKILSFVEECFDPASGGYRPCPGHDPHMLYTLSAVQILVTLDAVHSADTDAIMRFVKSQYQADGSFTGDKWGEVDTRFSFCAAAISFLLKQMDCINWDAAVDFVMRCSNFDGGFGTRPGSESHSGQIYCCLGFLTLTGQLHRVDVDNLGWWLAERQLMSGGLNGRPEKLPDVCYSWWVLASLSMLGRLHWIDHKKLSSFILASQDDETGGIADRPGDMPDPFHTLFGLAGLSLMANRDHSDLIISSGDSPATDEAKSANLKPINPVLCMAQEILDMRQLSIQYLPC